MASVFDVVYLIEQQVRAPAAVSYLDLWNNPWAAEAWGSIGNAEVPIDDDTTLYFSDGGWTSSPADSPANTWYDGRAITPLVIDRSIPATPDLDRRVALQVGAIEFANGDGYLDGVVNTFAVDGRNVTILSGPRSAARSAFTTMFSGSAIRYDTGDDLVRLIVRDNGYLLDLPIQPTLYGGTGGVDGTSGLAGRPKPLTYGKALNVTPAFIDPTNLVYQVHDGATFAIDAVYEGGGAVTAGSNYASYAALIAATLTAGTYGTCLAQGMFRLASSPSRQITADVRGDSYQGYVSKIGAICKRILTTRGGISLDALDTATFDFVDAFQLPFGSGIYLTDASLTVSGVLSNLMAGIGGWWGAKRSGLIAVDRLRSPSESTPTLYLTEVDVLEFGVVPLPNSTNPLNWQRTVNYQRNWTPQSTDLVGSVTQDRRQFLSLANRRITSSNSALRISYLQAVDGPVVQSWFDNAADSQALADYFMALHGVIRDIFQVTVPAPGYSIDIGDVVNLTYGRHGLTGGRDFRVIGISENFATRRMTLTLWG
jgi:hypothetical protein